MTDRSGQQIDRYRLIRFLGRGQFGDVYLAENVYRKTQVAIKVLNIRLTPEEIPAFLNEARNMRLRHPHIVSILDFGIEQTSGTPFLVMDYAPHGTLRTRHPRNTQVPLETVVHYVKQIASALQYAHEEHLIHHDVKPENILVGSQQELLLSDFGVSAIYKTGCTSLQQDSGIAGTAYYMAPEQFRGRLHPASDQYALAIVAYEWLTGTPPFTEGNFIQIGYQHNTEPPPPLRRKVPSIPQAAEQALMQALAKDPQQRFRSIQEFADVLEQVRVPKQATIIQPTPISKLELSHIQQGRPSAVPIGTTLLVYKRHRNYVTSVAWSPDGTCLASGSADGTVQIWEATNGRCLQTYTRDTGVVSSVAWSPDGKRIASGSANGTVQVWEMTSGQLLQTYEGHTNRVWSVTWSPDGTRLASGSADGTVQMWEVSSGRLLRVYKRHVDTVWSVAWSPDGTRLATSSKDQNVRVWEVTSERLLQTYEGHAQPVWSVAWSPDSIHLAAGFSDRTVQVWRVATGELRLIYTGHSMAAVAVAWSPDGTQLASGSWDTTVQVWEATSGHPLHTYKRHADVVLSVAWSPDGTRIASGSRDKTVQVWQAV
jgi:serine/threonine protein kinase